MKMEVSLTTSENEIIAICSDDEIGISYKEHGTWEPTSEEIVDLYEALDTKGVLDFEWQCPGRRSPSATSIKSDFIEKGTLSDDDVNKLTEPNEFDFKDEFSLENPSPKISPRRRANQASSAQKRVARLDKVMYDIQRHRKLDELEMQLNISANSPGSKPSIDAKT